MSRRLRSTLPGSLYWRCKVFEAACDGNTFVTVDQYVCDRELAGIAARQLMLKEEKRKARSGQVTSNSKCAQPTEILSFLQMKSWASRLMTLTPERQVLD